MRKFDAIARIDPDVVAYCRRVFARRGFVSKDPDGLAAMTGKGVDAATAEANEVMRLARDHTFH